MTAYLTGKIGKNNLHMETDFDFVKSKTYGGFLNNMTARWMIAHPEKKW
jgi:hypothetical protein